MPMRILCTGDNITSVATIYHRTAINREQTPKPHKHFFEFSM